MNGAPTSVRQLDYDGQEFAFEDPVKVGPRFDLYRIEPNDASWSFVSSGCARSRDYWVDTFEAERRAGIRTYRSRIVRVDETLVYDSEEPAQ